MGNTEEKCVTHRNCPSHHLAYYLKLNTKENIEGGEGRLMVGYKAKCSIEGMVLSRCLCFLH